MPPSAVVGFNELLKTAKAITRQVQQMEAAIGQSGSARDRSFAKLVVPVPGHIVVPTATLTAEQMDMVLAKMTLTHSNSGEADAAELLLFAKLEALQKKYDKADDKCRRGDLVACATRAMLAAKIAEIEAQLAAL